MDGQMDKIIYPMHCCYVQQIKLTLSIDILEKKCVQNHKEKELSIISQILMTKITFTVYHKDVYIMVRYHQKYACQTLHE